MPEQLEYTAELVDNISPVLDGLIAKFAALDSAVSTAAASMVTQLDAITAAATNASSAVSSLSSAASALAGPITASTQAITDNTVALQSNSLLVIRLTREVGDLATAVVANTAALDPNTAATLANTTAMDALSQVVGSLVTPLSTIATELGTLSGEMNANTAATLGNTQAMVDLTAASDLLRQTLNTTGSALVNLGTALYENTAFTDANTAAVRANTTSIDALTQIAARLEPLLAANTLALEANTTALTANAGAANIAAPAIAKTGQVSARGSMDLMLLGAALAFGTAKLIGMGSEADDALQRVAGFAMGSENQMQQMTPALESMAVTFGKSLTDMANGLYDVYSAGFRGADALNVLAQGAKLASSAGLDMHDTLSSISGLLRTYYNLDASKAAMVTNDFAIAVRDGKVDAHEFGNALSVVAITSHDAGFSLQEAMSGLSALTIGFKSPAQAGRDFNALMRDMAVGSDALDKRARSLGLSFDAVAYQNTPGLIDKLKYLWQVSGENQDKFKALIGTFYGWQAATTLLNNNAQDFNNTMADMGANVNALDTAFQIHTDTISYSSQRMGAALSVLAYQVEQFAEPAIKAIFDALANAFAWLGTQIEQHGALMRIILITLAAIIGGIVVGALVAATVAIWGFVGGAVAMAASIAWPIALVLALGGAFLYAYTQLQPFRDGLAAVVGYMSNTLGTVGQYAADMLGIGNTNVPSAPGSADGSSSSPGKSSGGKHSGGGGQPGKKKPQYGPVQAGSYDSGGPDSSDNPVGKSGGFDNFMNQLMNELGGTGGGGMTGQGPAFSVITGLGDDLTHVVGPANQVKVILDGLQAPLKFLATTFGAVAQGAMAFIHPMVGLLIPAFQGIWNTLKTAFIPVWEQLVDEWNNNLKPAFQQLMAGIQPVIPYFQALGAVVGAVVVGVVGVAFGILRGLITGIAGFLGGAVRVITGIIQVIIGIVHIAVTFIPNLFMAIVDTVAAIFTGKWGKVLTDFSNLWTGLWQGVLTVFKGIWNILVGIVQAVVGAIIGFVKGFVDGIVQFFVNLWNTLFGHSIIPDMIAGFFSFFGKLPTEVLAIIVNFIVTVVNAALALRQQVIQHIADLIAGIVNFFTQLPGQAITWMGNFVDSIVHGIEQNIGRVLKAAGSIIDAIKKFLGFGSPTEEGPGRTAHLWAPNLMQMFTQGMLDSRDPLIVAAQRALSGARAVLTSPIVPSLALGGSNLLGAGGNPLLSGAGNGSIGTVNATLQIQGGLGAGLQLMNPVDRANFVKQVSQELGKMVHMQTKTSAGYTGGT